MMWLQVSENIAQMANIPMLSVFDLELLIFLNLLSYLTWKNKKLKAEYKNKKK